MVRDSLKDSDSTSTTYPPVVVFKNIPPPAHKYIHKLFNTPIKKCKLIPLPLIVGRHCDSLVLSRKKVEVIVCKFGD